MNGRSLVRLAGVFIVLRASVAGAQHAHGGAVMYHGPRWSPDGQWILSSANLDGDPEIYLIRADGRELKQLTRNNTADDMAWWSEDGRRIVFISRRADTTAQFSMALDGSDIRPQPRDSVIARSPDGRTLLFETIRDGRAQLFAMTADRTSARLVSRHRYAEQGSISPDGKLLVYEERDSAHEIERSQIIVATADGATPRAVADGTDPSWSPDGQSILFKLFDERMQLWIATVSPAGEPPRKLAPGVHPHWSPDGRRIASMRDRPDGGADIWVMNRDGSEARCLTCEKPFR